MLDILLYSWVLACQLPSHPSFDAMQVTPLAVGVPLMRSYQQSLAESATIRHIPQGIFRDTLLILGCRLVGKNNLVACSCQAQVCNRQCRTIDERNMVALLIFRCWLQVCDKWIIDSMTLLLLPEGGLYNVQYKVWPRDGILGHHKRLESFAPCYSQSFLLADFKETILLSGFKNPTQENLILFIWIAFCKMKKGE